MERPGLPFV